jgi:hypothetical protein
VGVPLLVLALLLQEGAAGGLQREKRGEWMGNEKRGGGFFDVTGSRPAIALPATN